MIKIREGKENKYLKQTESSKTFGVVRKSTIGEEIGKKRGIGEEGPKSHRRSTRFRIHISIDRLIRKDITSLSP